MSLGDVLNMTTATEEEIIVAPFGIEITKGNNDVLIATLGGKRLRGPFSATRSIVDQHGKRRVPRDQAINFSEYPDTPGMQLYVNPAECTYVIVDPLEKDEKLQDELTQWFRNSRAWRGAGGDAKIRGVPREQHKIEPDLMKNLVREMYNLVTTDEAKVVRGNLPHMTEIDELPGRYLFKLPGVTQWNGPRYEDELEEYRLRVESLGN